MPDLTPEYRAHLRQNADEYGDPLIVQLLDALEETEEALARSEATNDHLYSDVVTLQSRLAGACNRHHLEAHRAKRLEAKLAEENLNASAALANVARLEDAIARKQEALVRIRRVLHDGRHDESCGTQYRINPEPCDCWLADLRAALKGTE
ncbi:hypothetical protein [Rhodococcus opacus]|uniref:hypothetical protein n=1 Tax=Rhodococcus opacus TaxID=37919 RepID=UPI001C47D700|nr:hypothetical protein [Rhodococcus opacus]MBV6758394.1 hypothetical protein [Rhodococcus opacus]